MSPDALWAHSQKLPWGGSVVVGPPSAAQAQRALKLLSDSEGRFADLDADVLADCGRVDPTSPARVVFDAAAMQVLVVRPQLPDLHHLAAWLEETPPTDTGPILVLTGTGPYPPDEIREALGVDVVATVPHDSVGVARLAEAPTTRAQGRSALLRAARSLAQTIVEHLAPPTNTAPLESLPSDEELALPADGGERESSGRLREDARP
jgi:hypothetical protein